MKAIADAGRAGPLRTEIANNRQLYFDEPVYAEVSKAKPLALAVNAAAASMHPAGALRSRVVDDALRALYAGRADARQQQLALRWLLRHPVIAPFLKELSHYERVLLQWLKPDGKGGFVPKYARDGGSL